MDLVYITQHNIDLGWPTITNIPQDHPRRNSLLMREKLVEDFRKGIVVPQGLIAHGRGECFDYLIGEETIKPAIKAIKAAAASLLIASNPVISVNGNTASLSPEKIIELSKVINAVIEVNLFHRTIERARLIARRLKDLGAENIVGVDDVVEGVPDLSSERRWISPKGILKADVVLVMLEDGDRTEALRKLGKFVIAIDLNPLSRTSRMANITIVDNVVRALDKLIDEVNMLKDLNRKNLEKIAGSFDNRKNLAEVLKHIVNRLTFLADNPDKLEMFEDLYRYDQQL